MTQRFLLTLAAGILLLQPAITSAQDQFRLNFQGICRTVNDAGRPVARLLSERDILRACATANGITNIRNLDLVYNRGAESNGDLIQVVNKTNNAVVCTAFKLLFQKAVPSGDGKHVERLAFLYNAVHTDAIGSATITEQQYFRKDGSLLRTVLIGRMQFWDEVYHANAVCTANFVGRQP